MSRPVTARCAGLLLAAGLLFATEAAANPAGETPPPSPDPGPPVETIHRDLAIFFGFDSTAFDADAERLLNDAGAYIVGSGPVRVLITGFADRAGDAAYNDELSQRRARAVADRLILLGVDPSWISINWRGEREPAAPTGDGQREVLNRRVVVMLRR